MSILPERDAPAVEPVRGFEPPGVWAYTDGPSVTPGSAVSVRVSAPASYELAVKRLGVTAILQRGAGEAAERRDAEILHQSVFTSATPQLIRPGSYVRVGGSRVPARPLTLGCWLRLWRAPCIDTLQWAWSGLVSEFDYPDRCRFGLLVNHAGQPVGYVGDGGPFRTAWLHVGSADLRPDYGAWHHLALVVDGDKGRLYLDGEPVSPERPVPAELADPPKGRLRIGATAEAGEAANFLDADIAQPFICSVAASEAELRQIARAGARHGPAEAGFRHIEGLWLLAEERGTFVADSSGHQRHGTLVNGGSWQVGGPAFDASLGGKGYLPERDRSRGHGLRLSSDDLIDCGWQAAATVTIRSDAPSGIYAATVRLTGQPETSTLTVPFVVVRTVPRHPGSIALLCATNTWHAYGRIPRDEVRVPGLTSSFYTRHLNGRPYFRLGLAMPIPRADPYGFESARAARTRHSHLVRPELFAQAWLTAEGYPFECITDGELDQEPGLLGRFAVLMICGHSEYWTSAMREGVESYLQGGGRVLCLSGNTLYWRVSSGGDGRTLESRKTSQAGGEWLPPTEWGERWHSDDGMPGGAWALIGAPSRHVLGLDMQGMIDDGAPASFSAFRVIAPDHFLLTQPERVPVSRFGTIGELCLNGPKASGYEMDATPPVVGTGTLPEGMEVLASATGQDLIEPAGPVPDHGGDIVYWRRPGGGEVVNAGSIAVSGALAVDPGIGTLVRNVLAHFGVERAACARAQ